jgi:PAS domain S-box-containing protein
MDSFERGDDVRHRTLERISDGVVSLDSDLRYTYVNSGAEDLLGVSRDDLLGEYIWDVFPSGAESEAHAKIQAARDTGQLISYERYNEEADLWLHVRVHPGDEGLSLVFSDVSERKERERELQETKTTLEAIIEASPDPIVMIDEELCVTLWNQAAENIFGWAEDEILGERAPFVPEEKEDEFQTFIENLDEGLSNQSEETVRETKDGERIDVSLSSSKIVSDGTFIGYLGIFKDISQRKAYERHLEEQRDSLEVLNQMVRHDIRNGLQVVLTYGSLLEEYVDEDGQEYLEKVQSNAEMAIALTQSARDLAEAMMRTGSEREPVSLKSTLGQQLDEIQSAYTDAIVTTAGPIPSVDVMADEMLSSVFRNLLTNAVDHNDKEVPTVSISVTEAADHVTVSIADNGSGVPDDQKESIFGRGEKGIESDGTGIGLYLAETLVDQYGGEVWVEDRATSQAPSAESIEGSEGTVFHVELDRAGED